MDDLISRKALLEELKTLERLVRDRVTGTPWDSPCRQRYQAQLFERERLKELVEKMPTAFDKEKVIDEIKNQLELSDTCAYESDYPTKVCYYKGRALGHEIDIEIVEKGGIDTVN